jgi:hypothetical protein
MATVTGLTADRMLAIEAASVVDGDIVDGQLVLTKHDGSTITAGSVVGPEGPQGPIGSDLDVLVQQAVLAVGVSGQIRAGRSLSIDDFAALGLDPPVALWNFAGGFTDSSGNGHDLTAKGDPTYALGLDGAVDGSVQLNGSNALFIPDTGAGDPFRVRVGSFGAWVKTAKRDSFQGILTKRLSATQIAYSIRIRDGNNVSFGISSDGTTELTTFSDTDVADNRWHFVVGTYDGITQRLYIDAVLEDHALRGDTGAALIFLSTAPLNLGSFGADATTAITNPNYGRIDEAFVTQDILSEDDIRNLYCAKIEHTLGAVPSGVSLSIYPGSKGSSLLVGDFPSTPLRLYNFSAGSQGDEGSNGAALGVVGSPVSVAGVDGTRKNAFNLNGAQRFTAPDTGLPAGTATCSYGCWFKFSKLTGTMYLVTWGTANGTNDTRLYIVDSALTIGSGSAAAVTGPDVTDGGWHFAVVVQDNAALDGLKRKLYLDAKVVASATTLQSIVLGGANKFVIGSSLASANNFTGQVDTVFVTDVALTLAQINNLYTKSLVDEFPYPKNAGDHIRAMTDEALFATFDTLDLGHKVSLKVMS